MSLTSHLYMAFSEVNLVVGASLKMLGTFFLDALEGKKFLKKDLMSETYTFS